MIAYDRLQAQLRAGATQNFDVVTCPPYTCFLNPDDTSPWSNYAIPDEPIEGDQQAALGRLVAVFQERGCQPRFEFIEEFAPQLAPALRDYGFTEEMRAILMVCTPATYQPAPSLVDVTVAEIDLASTAPLAPIQAAMTTQRRSFGSEEASAVDEREADQFRLRFRSTRLFGATVDGRMVSAGSLQPTHDGITEIAGIATIPSFRRQGIATLLTAHAVQAAFDQGLDVVFLTAGSVEAGRVYERVGFRAVGSGLAYSLVQLQ